MGRAVRSITRAVRRAVRGVGDIVGGVVDGVLGTNITGNNGMPEFKIPEKVEDPSLSTPTTPENSPIQNAQGDTTDTGFGDITSIFSTLNKQEDDWDAYLARYNKKNK